MSEQAYLSHILARLSADIDFLLAQGALSPSDGALIQAKLRAAASAPSSHPAPSSLEQQVSSLSLSSNGAGAAAVGRAVPPPPPPAPKPAKLESAAPPASRAVKRAKAVWDYPQTQPDDLAFRAGEVITVLEEENADWWRGEIGQWGIAGRVVVRVAH